jgi:hypothetical protein
LENLSRKIPFALFSWREIACSSLGKGHKKWRGPADDGQRDLALDGEFSFADFDDWLWVSPKVVQNWPHNA